MADIPINLGKLSSVIDETVIDETSSRLLILCMRPELQKKLQG